ncbi:MAG: anaerobic ribonucleoside-triphosphate reductase activating protein [Prevotellaceae bacterium]|jgi:anaerobic ribonucleoside-triphosphate reductase activating protein|nr:anaerobic ribonucleoside-triphosphate reductase activating protein [Prevotellaceae bacterium]
MSSIAVLDIVRDTTVDGPGFRTAIYAAGCPHRCPGCHNPQSWDIRNGTPCSIDALLAQVKEQELANVTFTGGDPMAQAEAFTELARRIRSETRKSVWCYTGYRYEQVLKHPRMAQLLPYVDVLVDGAYSEALRDETLLFAGSRNQRLVNVPESRKAGCAVLWTSLVDLRFQIADFRRTAILTSSATLGASSARA